ncbi:acyltransferase family protein [Ruminococcus albus]|uniref:Peptidoglycan/LPS O-acetylase OafA/YrhL, contains acyltransferase and SGNH-hydrolase domains n=1 Tax=Ruminococcus albus TaxID=1264 RepID=A0A1H7H1S8_RUMAL|nr:acyltransferase [Ruminococcus albus]SEK44271.1 Peptidoglycan/LPS O-acetylase OafA/YrhL, contains acyltransferase and SGNH-hydrolase domains [Ruminococcus albus]
MAEKKKARRNGKIELYRFIFSMYVLFFHIGKYLLPPQKFTGGLDVGFFRHGAMGVEFFFLVSGWLMAASVSKKLAAKAEGEKAFVPKEGLDFLKRKYLSLMPQHLPAFAIAFAVYTYTRELRPIATVKAFADSIPNLFLIQMSGANFTNPNHLEWYISAMLIAMAILYPILTKYYDAFAKYIAPLAALLICGYLIYTDKKLTGVTTWTGICFKAVLRAVAEVALGFTSFELSAYMKKKQFTTAQKVLLTLTEFGCLAGVSLYVISLLPTKYELYCLVLLFIMVTLAFSGVTCGTKALSNGFFCFLGKLSLPIYLSQIAAIDLTAARYSYKSSEDRIITALIFTAVFTAITFAAGEAWNAWKRHNANKQAQTA